MNSRDQRTRLARLTLASAIVCVLSVGVTSAQEDTLAEPASWKPLSASEAKDIVTKALAGKDELVLEQAKAIWEVGESGAAPFDLLDRTALTAALVDDETRELVSFCESTPGKTTPAEPDWKALSSPLSDNLRLYYARWLVNANMYDEAKQQLEPVSLDHVVDPAALLFYQSVVAHRLMDKSACVTSTNKLLENAGVIPRRYEQLARLMSADIAPLKIDSPDEITRLMGDVERRLDLGRAGKRVRKQEEDIVEKLSKIIKQIEEQLKKQQQQSASGGQGGQPLNDSRPVGQKGPGDVENREHKNRSTWGDLPPEQRRSTLQQISRELGAHYREVVEEYFRKIAKDSE